MYEKGSVRAEPTTNKHERMKIIMKKFLSLLLALTMVLSLVVVPARAHGHDFRHVQRYKGIADNLNGTLCPVKGYCRSD